ncbi:MAG: Ig-like domain-containing protein [Thomasclavelia sp.]
MNKQETTLVKGTSETLKATINPSDTTDSKALTWTTSNNRVATVDGNGKVTGVSEGNATITVRTSNGKTASCKSNSNRTGTICDLYQTHIEDYGWQDIRKDGQMAGTSGESKRLEGIKINLDNNSSYNGTIEYCITYRRNWLARLEKEWSDIRNRRTVKTDRSYQNKTNRRNGSAL